MKLQENLRNDLPASIVVFFVAVPLCLGIALASGAPLFSGLVAGIIGGIVVGILSGSPLGVSGPAAGLAVIVLQAIEALGFERFLAAVFIAGVFQLLLGVAKAGVLSYFFPSSVIRGMLAGIGVIIFLKQIPHAFGYDKDPEGEMQFSQPDGETTFSELSRMLEAVEPSALFVSVVALLILILWETVLTKKARIFKIIQGPLVAVAFGILYQIITSRVSPDHALSSDHLVSVPVTASFQEFVGLFTNPDWSALKDTAVWITAVTLAIVGSLETLLCLDATDKLDPQKRVTPANRELFAQGIGNMLSGLVGGLPVTQVIVRSSANIQSGARTKISAILHGVLMLVFVMVLPHVLNLVPLAVLASILFVVGYKLAKPALFKEMWNAGSSQFLPFTITVLGIVFTDLLTGIGLGLAVATVVILYRSYLNSHFMNMEEADSGGRHRVRLTLAEQVTFLNKGAILRELNEVADGSVVTIDQSRCHSIDHDVLEIIDDFRINAEQRGIELEVIGAPRHGAAPVGAS